MRAQLTTPAERRARLGHYARVFLLPALIVAAAPTSAAADASVSLDVGMRFLGERTWDPIDNDWTAEGVRFTYARSGWPVGLAFGWHTSDGEKTKSEFVPDGGWGCFLIWCSPSGETVQRTVARGSLRELSLGVDKDWVSGGSKARGFVGGGVSQVWASLDNNLAGFNDSDRSAGLWGHAGLVRTMPLSASDVHLEIGVELRVLQGTRLRLGGEGGDADYVQLGLISGIRWSP